MISIMEGVEVEVEVEKEIRVGERKNGEEVEITCCG